jgi:Ca2+-binding EF-hand superfamily protein
MKFKGLTLLAGLTALSLSACSGATDQTTAPENSQSASSSVANDTNAARQTGPDAMRFMKRFDRNKDGVVEVAELPAPMQKWLGKADTDGDGKLSEAELRAHADTMKKQHFARMDKNSDGALSADEVGERKWKHLETADADKDGRVTQSELDQAFASGKMRMMRDKKFGGERGARGEGHGRWIQKMDANQDGALTADEVGAEKWSRISVADADGDGKVTFDELKAAHDSGKLAPMKRGNRPPPAEAPEAPVEAPAAQ